MTDTTTVALGPTGPLPIGWHRLTYRKTTFAEAHSEPLWAVSEDIVSIAALMSSLKTEPTTVIGSVVMESWTDFPPHR